MKLLPYFVTLCLLGLVVACRTAGNEPNRQLLLQYQQTGDSVTIQAQQALLKNLTAAAEEGGLGYAVEYCHVKADSIAKLWLSPQVLGIQRLSSNNRNPNNALSNAADIALFTHYTRLHAQKSALPDTVIRAEGGYTYYKPILLAMPTCLKCHGNPDTDIDAAALAVINQKYPADRARNYQLNDLRGMWKIQFAGEPTTP